MTLFTLQCQNSYIATKFQTRNRYNLGLLIFLPGQEFWGATHHLCVASVVDNTFKGLVQCTHKLLVIVEHLGDHGAILFVHLKQTLHKLGRNLQTYIHLTKKDNEKQIYITTCFLLATTQVDKEVLTAQ